jgi:hypothetical protein
MKKFLLYISFALACFTATAQTPDAEIDDQQNPKREAKIEALYIAYISKQLNLTPEEAQKFWPIHSQYNTELKAINKNNLSEIDREQAVLNIKKKYVANFNKVLGNERCNNFFTKDAAFRDKLRNRLKQMRQQRMNNGLRPDGQPRGGGGMRKNMQPPN